MKRGNIPGPRPIHREIASGMADVDFRQSADVAASRVMWMAGMTGVTVILLAITTAIYSGDKTEIAETPIIEPGIETVAAVTEPPAASLDTPSEAAAATEPVVLTELPAAACAEELHALARLSTIYFDQGSALLDLKDLQSLQQLARATQLCPGMQLQVWGHADGSGDDRTNLEISQQRADNTLTAMAAMGFDVAGIRAIGAGASLPQAQGDTDDALDRRVEFRVIPARN